MNRVIHAILSIALVMSVASSIHAADDQSKFTRVAPQYIAALADPTAKSGSGAETWGLWRLDPGPRGVPLTRYERLKEVGGVAPAQWTFDNADWWLEENGRIMEKPTFPLAAGRYLVTGGREVTAALTVLPPDKDGHQRWQLSDGATLYDVTHLGCRSARYTPASGQNSCSPAKAPRDAFRVAPGRPMPAVEGCHKQDYAVLIVIGVANDRPTASK
jgi:hypothetical protein